MESPLLRHFGYGDVLRLPVGVKAPSESRLIEVWHDVKAQLITRWISKHPGSRPFFWWKHDAPELRRRIDGRKHPFYTKAYQQRAENIRKQHPNGIDLMATSWGMPRYTNEPEANLKYETQTDYLRRLELMLPGEEEAIEARNGPEPVACLR